MDTNEPTTLLDPKDRDAWHDLMARKGRFIISLDVLEMGPKAAMAIMANCIITRAEYHWDMNRVEYSALSYWFKPVGMGEVPPVYNWTITTNEHGDYVVTPDDPAVLRERSLSDLNHMTHTKG